MGKCVLLAAVLTLLGGVAFARHAISLEPEAAPAAPTVASSAAPTPQPALRGLCITRYGHRTCY